MLDLFLSYICIQLVYPIPSLSVNLANAEVPFI